LICGIVPEFTAGAANVHRSELFLKWNASYRESAMSSDEDLRNALMQIAEIASAASGDCCDSAGDQLVCTPKSLPRRLLMQSAQVAAAINPVNAPSTFEPGLVVEPSEIAVLTSKYWGPAARRLSVSFMESTPTDLKNRILGHMNAWTRTGGVSFALTNGVGDVRISRGAGGYWSYLGTDIRLIPTSRPTMNLQAFTMSTSESEYRRVVRHETGHTLGCPHEHLRRELVNRLDREKTYAYFLRTNGWDRAKVDSNVLTPLDERTIMGTPTDQTSIMCYQLPGSITRDGRPILGGTDINQTDYAFIGRIYPRGSSAPMSTCGDGVAEAPATAVGANDWDPAEDVESPLID
jgi:hypothetical protein